VCATQPRRSTRYALGEVRTQSATRRYATTSWTAFKKVTNGSTDQRVLNTAMARKPASQNSVAVAPRRSGRVIRRTSPTHTRGTKPSASVRGVTGALATSAPVRLCCTATGARSPTTIAIWIAAGRALAGRIVTPAHNAISVSPAAQTMTSDPPMAIP
jgi:hypothetical protein